MKALLEGKHPFAQLIVFCLIALVSVLVFSFLALAVLFFIYDVNLVADPHLISDLSNPLTIKILKMIQLFNAVSLFIIPPLIFIFLVPGSPREYISLKKPYKPFFYLLVIFLMMSALPLINLLAELNQRMDLPEGFSGMEAWMKDREDAAEKVIKAFLAVETMPALLFNLLLMAVIPAVGEELLFRGVLQRIFADWSGNTHAAIWTTAILFSALHLQFYGFLPRMLMGVLFGYLLVWSGSLFIPILAHFINNALAVILSYYIYKGIVPQETEEIGAHEGAMYYNLVSLLLVSGIIYLFYMNRRKTPLPG